MDINRLCSEVKTLARSVGEYLVAEQAELKRKDVEMKGTRDYVTYVDKTAEEMLVKGLQALLPDSGFLTEEGTVEYVEKTYTWIIDPLDGTSNYIHGLAPYNVSIALMHKKEIILGVVYDPLANEMFTAITGEPALLNNEPINVSKKDEIKNGFIGFGIPYVVNNETESILKNIWKLFGEASFRIEGSAAIELCYVACGRYDAYIHSGLSPWDVAAGTFIVQQAGGKITDYKSSNNYIFGKQLVATNSSIHASIMKRIINLR